MSKQKIKPIKAWMVMPPGRKFSPWTPVNYAFCCSIFEQKRWAVDFMKKIERTDSKIIQVLITPLGDKKK